ncbi:MAG: VIT1/CCC1 transporter family protein [Candidatus Nanopelagicales bacterium]|nr:VIT1/CCC1 transporter family protein [Candidatus Nanopelagicales bacterium]
MSNDPKRFLRYLEEERKASLLYRSLATSLEGERREALLELADIEDRHARHWIAKLTEAGIDVPAAPTDLQADDQALVARAHAMGVEDVLAHLEQVEEAANSLYDDEPEAPQSMVEDEASHAEAFQRMRTDSPVLPIRGAMKAPGPDNPEPWHRGDSSGTARAAVFGISDGLVSNTALVMGFAGAAPDNRTILFAGLAGLLAGSFSMAAGEYVSVASQRDLFRREIEKEASELATKPEEEQKELELIYRAKGVPRDVAAATAAHIMQDPKLALDTLAREELGLNPDELGSPVKVAVSSFIAFAIGAVIAVIPFLFTSGTLAVVLTALLSTTALLIVGGVVGKLSGRGIVFSAFRQLLWGAGAAAITFAVGRIIGVNVT